MQILIVLFSLTGLGSLYGMIRYGGWNFTIHSANLVFGYIFLFSAVMVLWSFLALREMAQESSAETAPVKSKVRSTGPGKKGGSRKR